MIHQTTGELRFGSCALNPRTRSLVRDRRRVDLQQQPMELLLLLVEQADALVTRELIRQRIWPDAVVDYDQSINCIKNILDVIANATGINITYDRRRAADPRRPRTRRGPAADRAPPRVSLRRSD